MKAAPGLGKASTGSSTTSGTGTATDTRALTLPAVGEVTLSATVDGVEDDALVFVVPSDDATEIAVGANTFGGVWDTCAPLLGLLFWMIYRQELTMLDAPDAKLAGALGMGFVKAYAGLVVVTAIVGWWLVLTHKSREVAQEESNRQTQALNEQTEVLRDEIASHRRTDEELRVRRMGLEAGGFRLFDQVAHVSGPSHRGCRRPWAAPTCR